MKFKIVFFDCDGVLLFGHPLSRLEKELNIYSTIHQQWDDYYSGKITFEEWIGNIEFLYKKAGLNKKNYDEVIDFKNYEINKEAEDLVKYLKERNYEMAIISSGSGEYVSQVAKHFGIKYYRINTILVFDKNGKFIKLKTFGEDPDVKVSQIKEICDLLDVNPIETVFVGDSDNDLKAFEYTKHGILYSVNQPELEKFAWKKINNLGQIISILENANSN